MEKEIKERIKAAHLHSAQGVSLLVLPLLLLILICVALRPTGDFIEMLLLLEIVIAFTSLVFLLVGLWEYWGLFQEEAKSIWFLLISVVDVGALLVDIFIIFLLLSLLFGPGRNVHYYF